MFIVQRKLSRRQATMERRYAFHLGEAVRAALAGSYDKAQTHSAIALSISRELYAVTGRHRPDLAAALASHALSSAAYGRVGETVALLTESAGHYAALANADPATYEVPRIDVLTRIATAADAAGNTADAVALLHEIIRMYDAVPPAPRGDGKAQGRRDLGRARARFHLGRCLLKTGDRDAGLAQIESGLADAELAWERLDLSDESPAWLSGAPECVQLAAPDWATAAVRAMVLHAAAGRWAAAARAARAAIRMSAGLAEIGGDAQREAHAAVEERAAAILARAPAAEERANDEERAAEEPQACPASTKRLRERSTSASAAARSTHLMPSTDLPGSRSL
jgi:tetratricopeptide (TPR) repeat protein